MTLPAPRIGQCPNCGATVEFKLGASLVAVCGSCQAVVARKGLAFEAIGKVADVIPTGSRISLGVKGKLDQVSFEVVGRLQYEWNQGVWDEWYLGFADGRWGWLAEAQGRFYVTFKAPPRPVPQNGVVAGESVFLEGLGRFVVSDVKQAKIVGVQGELPSVVKLGEMPLTADLESARGAFATIDYGVTGETAAVYVGQQVEFEALHLGGAPSAAPPRGARPTGQKLACPNCGAPLTLRVPDLSVRVTCQSCHFLLDLGHGAFQVIGAIARGKSEPTIPLGTSGTLRGLAVMCVGFMVRSCQVDGTRYAWREYLLFQAKTQGFLWLVQTDGHWQLAQPLSAASVHAGADAEYAGQRYRHFSSVTGEVETVLGEFYWAVQQGDRATLDDYIAPPMGLSRERTESEASWSRLSHLEPQEVADAFARPGIVADAREGVGELQPWPWEAAWTSMQHWMVIGALGLIALMVLFALRPTEVYLDHTFSPSELSASDPLEPGAEPPPPDARTHTFLSKPFEVSSRALSLEFDGDVAQSWAFTGGAVIHEESSESAPFGLEISSYSGVEDGESWSEGSRSASTSFTAPSTGTTLLRADMQWDPKAFSPPRLRLRLSSESFSGWQFFACFGLLLWPLVIAMQRSGFERVRWENSNLGNPYATAGSDDE
jgi:hypothetical protein